MPSLTSAQIQAKIDALPASNGVPEGQQMGGVVDLDANVTHTLDTPIYVPSNVKLRLNGSLMTGALAQALIQLRPVAATGQDSVYNATIEGGGIWNTGTGKAIAINPA